MDRLEKLIEAGLVLSSEHSLDAVLQRIVELAAEITGARYGALGVLAPEGDHLLEFVTTGITPEQRAAIGDLPVGHGLLGLLISDAKPMRAAPISSHPASVGFPPHHPAMTSLLGAPVISRGRVFGNIYLTDKRDADAFTKEDEDVLVTLAAQAGVAIENARLQEESLARSRVVAAFQQIATAMVEAGGSDDALQLVGRLARELLRAAGVTVALPDETGTLLHLAVAEGLHSAELAAVEFAAKGSVSGEVLRAAAPLVIDEASAGRAHPALAFDDVGPMVIVPLIDGGGAFGTLAAFNGRGGRRFGDDDASLLSALARQVVLALEYARAQADARRVAVMDDRERIAKDLHDGVIQALFAVGMGLQGAAMTSEDERMVERVEASVGEIDRVIRDLRNYIFGLRPGILADRQLDEALHALAAEFEQRSGVVTAVAVDEGVASQLSSSANDVLQIAREALSNVGRHADAQTCRLSLVRNGDRVVLEVDDDGRGFDSDTAPRGDGLSNIDRRAADLGGEVHLSSVPGQGTLLRLSLPLAAY